MVHEYWKKKYKGYEEWLVDAPETDSGDLEDHGCHPKDMEPAGHHIHDGVSVF